VEQRATYRNTLQYALAIAGSELALSARLGATISLVKRWLNGTEPIPDSAFLDAVDVIVSATPADIARTRASMYKAGNGQQQHPQG